MLTMILAAVLSSFSPNAEARRAPLQWTLDCTWQMSSRREPVGAPKITVLKTAFKGSDGKWDAKYSIVLRSRRPGAEPRVFELVHAGSGDEDYNEFYVKGRNDGTPVQAASIQNQFKWASVSGADGISSYDCR